MDTKEVMILLLISFFCSCTVASLHPPGFSSTLVHLQGNMEYKGEVEHLSDNRGGGSVIPHQNKLFGGRGVSGGHSAGTDGKGNGGGSHSTYPQGGAVIPLYAAGAANGHRNHHSEATCIQSRLGSSSLAAIFLTYLLLNFN